MFSTSCLVERKKIKAKENKKNHKTEYENNNNLSVNSSNPIVNGRFFFKDIF